MGIPPRYVKACIFPVPYTHGSSRIGYVIYDQRRAEPFIIGDHMSYFVDNVWKCPDCGTWNSYRTDGCENLTYDESVQKGCSGLAPGHQMEMYEIMANKTNFIIA